MKRSMLLVLAGFGLASMLFALVAFVGSGENESESKGLVYVRVFDSWNAFNPSGIKINYPDGQLEEITFTDFNALAPAKGKKSLPNTEKVGEVLNKIQSQGYRYLHHSSSMGETAFYETYIFEKE